jgi:ketosteroid isomerase-like protein
MATGQSDSERAIRALSEAFALNFNAGDADRLVRAFYTEDARLLPPDLPMIRGRSEIREALQGFLGAGMGDLTIESYDVEIARSGDLAYGMGTFSLGRPAPSRGKFVEIYRQQLDGSWRCVVDMFSNDEAAA